MIAGAGFAGGPADPARSIHGYSRRRARRRGCDQPDRVLRLECQWTLTVRARAGPAGLGGSDGFSPGITVLVPEIDGRAGVPASGVGARAASRLLMLPSRPIAPRSAAGPLISGGACRRGRVSRPEYDAGDVDHRAGRRDRRTGGPARDRGMRAAAGLPVQPARPATRRDRAVAGPRGRARTPGLGIGGPAMRNVEACCRRRDLAPQSQANVARRAAAFAPTGTTVRRMAAGVRNDARSRRRIVAPSGVGA